MGSTWSKHESSNNSKQEQSSAESSLPTSSRTNTPLPPSSEKDGASAVNEPTEQPNEQERKQQQEKLNDQDLRLIKKVGVMIPPSFGIPTSYGKVPSPSYGSINNNNGLSIEPCSLSHFNVLQNIISPIEQYTSILSPQHRLLSNEHLTSGIWIRASPASADIGGDENSTSNANVLASLFAASEGSPTTSNFLLPSAGGISFAKLLGGTSNWTAGGAVRALSSSDSDTSTAGGAYLKYEPLGLSWFVSSSSSYDKNVTTTKIGSMVSSYKESATCTRRSNDHEQKEDDEATNNYHYNIGISMSFGQGNHHHNNTMIEPREGEGWLSIEHPKKQWSLGASVHVPLKTTYAENAKEDPFRTTTTTHKDINKNQFPFSRSPMLSSMIVEPSGTPHVSYYLTCDLTSSNKNDSGSSSSSSFATSPLIFNFFHQSHQPRQYENSSSTSSSSSLSSASIGQVVTFDRAVINPFETRCPKIRNTFSWAVELSKKQYHYESQTQNNNGSSSTTGSTTSSLSSMDDRDPLYDPTKPPNASTSSMLTAALAWQIYRNVATKLRINSHEIKGAIMCQRWAYPKITCSLIGSISKGGTLSYGLGMELDTTECYTNDVIYAAGRKGPQSGGSSDQHNNHNNTAQTKIEI